MKKIFLIILSLISSLLLVGCGSKKEEDIIKKLSKKIESASSYHIDGIFELMNNDENYAYDINVDFKAEENFRVSLINKTNNHEQIILRNNEGVYVLTPSLNKSFKFQSDWPHNNSQTYILQTILEDIKNDSEKDVKKTDTGYTITTSVNYTNKQELVKQNIYLDKDANILKIEVMDVDNVSKIIMNFNNIDINKDFDEEYFNVDKNVIKSESLEKPVTNIESIVFPMYVPTDTYLTSQEVLSVNGGERAILTFNGEKSFTVIQETVSNQEPLSINVDGEPHLVLDTVGVISDSYVSWISNGIEYYVISEDLTKEELLSVANSISVMPVSK